ncbi:MAG: hypothetical protein LBK64_01725 [Spirochaetaceae bacterium]|jgi:hypothetical protein|nr:hypothetical protein [Spirochaetaceae bacterium]
MANEKKPSIYYDRGTIGSQDELDEYGVWVKSEPQDLTAGSAAAGSDFDLPDIEELPDMESLAPDDAGDDSFGFSGDESSPGGTEEDDLELPEFDDAISESFGSESLDDAPGASEDSSFTDISMDDFLDASGENSTDSAEEPAGETAFDDSGLDLDIDFNDSGDSSPVSPVEEDVEFDDIAAVDKDLRSSAAAPEGRNQGADLSTQLLMKIANELSSIKVELSSLKSELAAHTSGEAPVQKKAAREEGGGFFDEEEDEKIALTGDELNNILNTADFTEEAGRDATAGEAEEIDLGGDFPDTTHEGLALRDDEIPSDTPFTEEIEEDLILDENILDEKDNEVLKELRESGAKPMTPAPEDTSYLEETEDVLDEAEPAFDAALPGEPDFDAATDFDIAADIAEPEAEEPELEEIGIDLEEVSADDASPVEAAEDDQGPVEEELELDLDLGDFDDDTHSLESAEAAPEEESFASVLPEGFVVESDEASSFGGQEDEVEILPGESSDGFGEDAIIGLDEPELPPAEPDFSAAETPVIDASEAPAAGFPDAAEDSSGFLEASDAQDSEGLPPNLRVELKTVLSYMDQLLESLPEDKIEEFAKSEYYETYKKLFEELGLA